MEHLRSSCTFAHRECTFPMSFETVSTLYRVGIPYTMDDVTISVSGVNAIDLVGLMFGQGLHEATAASNAWNQVLGSSGPVIDCVFLKTLPDAITPTKAHSSDVGLDLTIVSFYKKVSSQITMYDTGIQLRIPFGYYAEVHPRSSLSKTGYMLANSVGIIDPSYHGNVLIALIKVDPSTDELQLPFRGFQIIFKEQLFVSMKEMEERKEREYRLSEAEIIEETSACSVMQEQATKSGATTTVTSSSMRGAGGFGSSG